MFGLAIAIDWFPFPILSANYSAQNPKKYYCNNTKLRLEQETSVEKIHWIMRNCIQSSKLWTTAVFLSIG